jgi:hypothetical protein
MEGSGGGGGGGGGGVKVKERCEGWTREASGSAETQGDTGQLDIGSVISWSRVSKNQAICQGSDLHEEAQREPGCVSIRRRKVSDTKRSLPFSSSNAVL